MPAADMHIHVPRESGLPEIEIEAEPLRYFRAPPPPKGSKALLENARRALNIAASPTPQDRISSLATHWRLRYS